MTNLKIWTSLEYILVASRTKLSSVDSTHTTSLSTSQLCIKTSTTLKENYCNEHLEREKYWKTDRATLPSLLRTWGAVGAAAGALVWAFLPTKNCSNSCEKMTQINVGKKRNKNKALEISSVQIFKLQLGPCYFQDFELHTHWANSKMHQSDKPSSCE